MTGSVGEGTSVLLISYRTVGCSCNCVATSARPIRARSACSAAGEKACESFLECAVREVHEEIGLLSAARTL